MFVDDTSNMAEECAAVPVVLIPTCPFDERVIVTNSKNAIVFKSDTCFFMMLLLSKTGNLFLFDEGVVVHNPYLHISSVGKQGGGEP